MESSLWSRSRGIRCGAPHLLPCSGVYFVAPDQDDAEGWVDALLLLAHLHRTGGTDGVRAALSVRR